MRKGMIKISVFYPSGVGNTFDMDYYCSTHAQLVKQSLGAALKGFTVDKGLAGGAPGNLRPI